MPSAMTPRDEDALTEIQENPFVTSKLPIMEKKIENNKSLTESPHGDDRDISMFQFDSNVDTKWAEQEDMDSTFQRRTSLDYGGYF
ncbi:ASN_collapsed_G0056190.mRNA.1.CDS.1 [Saccharomyces cerevisiae]|nr:ASN_collapsed_G0056190.mRNA.1.CDS.1 [Saccharomyces cerevisiae]